MGVILVQVARDDMEELWKMQVEAFSDLLEKYQDYDVSPAAESFVKVMARFEQPWTTYYFITADGKKVGAVRIVDKKDGSRKRETCICTKSWDIIRRGESSISTTAWTSCFTKKTKCSFT